MGKINQELLESIGKARGLVGAVCLLCFVVLTVLGGSGLTLVLLSVFSH
jgi:hypothetical protein